MTGKRTKILLPEWEKTKRYFLMNSRGEFFSVVRRGGWDYIEAEANPHNAKSFDSFEDAKGYRDREGHLRHGTWTVVEITETWKVTKTTALLRIREDQHVHGR